jgi:hypothetical protein
MNDKNPKLTKGFGPVRVLNEDYVAPHEGFPTHPHKEYEIITYMIKGELIHHDSMQHIEAVKDNEVQFISAGSGMEHSEFNRQEEKTHLLQIWVKPFIPNLKPSYAKKAFYRSQKLNKLCPIVSSNEELDCISIHQWITLYASIVEENSTVEGTLTGKQGIVQLVTNPGAQLTVQIDNMSIQLDNGDVLFITSTETNTPVKFTGTSATPTEFIFFDLYEIH